MQRISLDELQEKIERGDHFVLLAVGGEWAYRAMHIPGSVLALNLMQVIADYPTDTEVVIYGHDWTSLDSKYAYVTLGENGFTNVRRYQGGLGEWARHGLPMEGEWTDSE